MCCGGSTTSIDGGSATPAASSSSVCASAQRTVFGAAERAIERARAGEGPSLLELKTYRVRSLAEGWADLSDPQEIETWKRRDPLDAYRRRLLERGVLTNELATSIEDEARKEMQAAQVYADQSPFPEPEAALEDLYA